MINARHDQTEPGQTGSGGFEELRVGNWRDQLGGWLRRKWRVGLIFLIVFCLGLAIWGYAVHAWTNRQQHHRPRIAATLYQFSVGSGHQVGLRLRNRGPDRVTIDKIELHVPGFRSSSDGLHPPETLAPHGSADASLELSPDCRAKPRGAASVRLRVQPRNRTTRWVTDKIPLAPTKAQTNFGDNHIQSCTESHFWLKLKTLQVSSAAGDTLIMRVRLSPEIQAGDGPRHRVRRLRLAPGESGDYGEIEASFQSSRHDRSSAWPETGTLRIRAKKLKKCAKLPSEPVPLEAVTGSAGETVDVSYDFRAAAAILRFTKKHCE
jgi:hypothetical protein